MKRAAIITAFAPDIYKGGIETFIVNLRALLVRKNISVDIHYALPETTLLLNKSFIALPDKIIPRFMSDCFMLGRAFSRIEKKYDFVITNNFYGMGYFSPRIKSFNFYHSSHAGYADALKNILAHRNYRELKYIYGHIGDRLGGRGKMKIAVSNCVKAELEKYYGFRDITVVNHGIDTSFFSKIEDVLSLRKKWEISPDAFVGIYVGRWEPGKGIDTIESAFKLHPDVIWLLAIGNSECPLSSPNIRVIKDADRETIRELYSLSDFMLFPSCYEGFGLTIIEAMASKLPVICAEVGVAKDFLRFDALRKLILPNCGKLELIKEINDRISFLKNSSHEKKEIANTGRLIIERDYNIDEWEKRMTIVLGLSN